MNDNEILSAVKNLAHDDGEDPEAVDEASRGGEDEDDHGATENENAAKREPDSDPDPDEDTTGIGQISYRKANKLDFRTICQRLETLDQQRGKNKSSKPMTKEQKLELLVPAAMLKKLETSSRPSSPFPLFRLLMPKQDSSRTTITKEKSIAMAYSDALSLKGTPKSKALYDYKNPIILAAAQKGWDKHAGDLSSLVEAVTSQRVSKNSKSIATVGIINEKLDELVAGLAGKQSSNVANSQQWRSSSQSQSQALSGGATRGKKNNRKVREQFIRDLIEDLKITPLEHKWIVRILLEDIKVGLGWQSILSWFSDHSTDLWKSHNSLKAVCDKLCDPKYVALREQEQKRAEELAKQERFRQLFAYPNNPDPVAFGNTISAMKSERTSFESFMADIATKHREALANTKLFPKDEPERESLALKFPAFMSEIKLDGERMIVHVHHKGKVTMHTRQGTWYSPIYSPCVGPALRRAVSSKYDVDVILDGEILAWDNESKQFVEFGNNRTVAKLRRDWLAAHDPSQLKEEDLGLHKGEDDTRVVRYETFKGFGKDKDNLEGGDSLWIQFVAFDILYISGPEAGKCLQEGLPPESGPCEVGSVTHLSLFERKKLLYHMLEVQENEVTIVESVVIRPNGDCEAAQDYFTSSELECGYPKYVLDSAKWTLNSPQWTPELEAKRLGGRSDLEISQRRTNYVNQFYQNIVEEQKKEGLMFKDLASPYILRTKTLCWLKIKPDYSNTSTASDIDVVIIGGDWAVGRRSSGQLSSFLGACVDSQDPEKFFTFVRLNAKSLNQGQLEEIWKYTGFQKATGDSGKDLGKWFQADGHHDSLPEFISQRSFQNGKEDNLGWRFDKKIYPALFIKPEDSVVVTVNAGEIVTSDEYSAGITLRFPRATAVRYRDKKPSDIENEVQLNDMRKEHMSQMSKNAASSSSAFKIVSPSKRKHPTDGFEFVRRFCTAEQYLRMQKKRKKGLRKAPGRVKHVTSTKQRDGLAGNALAGLKFCVQEGHYSFDHTGLDGNLAKSEGWYDEALEVGSASDVESFIVDHGGTIVNGAQLDVFVIGGSPDDLKVISHVHGYDKEKAKQLKKAKKESLSNSPDINVPGVLKWTYVFSIVHLWLAALEQNGFDSDDANDAPGKPVSIKSTKPSLLVPRFFDYLSQSKVYSADPCESILQHGTLDVQMMERALSTLEESSKPPPRKRPRKVAKDDKNPWQHVAIQQLMEEDRWIMSCQYETLWPYGSATGEKKQPVVLYADLFGDDFGLDSVDSCETNRWNQAQPNMMKSSVASSLPLLRAMGSFVTCHLHKGVSHILTDGLSEGISSISWRPGSSLRGLKDIGHMGKLLSRLEATMDQDHAVLLVSREWVENEWQE